MPIWVYKPELYRLRGVVKLDMTTEEIRPGIIKLGFRGNRCFPNNGFTWSNEGTVVFKGKCQIGNNSSIVTGPQGIIEFGDNFLAPSSVKLLCYCGITFGSRCVIGWDSTIQDTDFHPLYDIKRNKFRKAFGKIMIGDFNWFSQGCLVLHSVNTADYSIFAARSVITRNCKTEMYTVHAGNPVHPVIKDVKLDFNHYMVDDYES